MSRDQLFALYHRGVITESEVQLAFMDLLLEAADDKAALQLCDSLPDWFRDGFRDWLVALASRDFAVRSFCIGDTRSAEQVAADERRHQAFLKRMAPEILARLS